MLARSQKGGPCRRCCGAGGTDQGARPASRRTRRRDRERAEYRSRMDARRVGGRHAAGLVTMDVDPLRLDADFGRATASVERTGLVLGAAVTTLKQK